MAFFTSFAMLKCFQSDNGFSCAINYLNIVQYGTNDFWFWWFWHRCFFSPLNCRLRLSLSHARLFSIWIKCLWTPPTITNCIISLANAKSMWIHKWKFNKWTVGFGGFYESGFSLWILICSQLILPFFIQKIISENFLIS